MSNNDVLTKEELADVKNWLDENDKILPAKMKGLIKRLLRVYLMFSQDSAKATKMVALLRRAMGITPKSEKGKKPENSEQLCLEQLTAEEQEKISELKKKRDELAKEKAAYDQKLRRLIPKPKVPEQMELAPAEEMMFSTPSTERDTEASKEKVNRMEQFDREQGLHSTYDKVKRMDLKIVATETIHEVETVTDFSTGKSVRASMKHVGPEGFQLTWRAISNLMKLHVGFAIPMHRLELIIGQPEFTSGKISRVLKYIATELLPIYLYLIQALSDAKVVFGDDTKTKVLALDEEQDSSNVASAIDSELGWAAPRADGKGDKKGLNVSLLMGRTDPDPRSTIRFYRTHLGSVGNLLTKMLEWRTRKAGDLFFQGDLSTTNLPSEQKLFKFHVAGCSSHARRPYWQNKEEDEGLCYFMLRGFLILSQIEKIIDAQGRTEETVLKWRGRYGRKVWEALRNRCIAVTTGEVPGRFTYRKGTFPQIWPNGYDLHRASRYIIKHYNELTLYLSHPELHFTNNISERALRIEKCMLSGSKFRKNRNGRAVLDILRTINATCTAAKVEIADYLRYVFENLDKVKDHPENFTPYAVALELEKANQTA